MKKVEFLLPGDLYERVREYAGKRGFTMDRVLVNSLGQYFRNLDRTASKYKPSPKSPRSSRSPKRSQRPQTPRRKSLKTTVSEL